MKSQNGVDLGVNRTKVGNESQNFLHIKKNNLKILSVTTIEKNQEHL
jgi:hypothetical protein